MTASLPPIREMATRFLYPFYFAHGELASAAQALLDASKPADPSHAAAGTPDQLWESVVVQAPHLYREELLPKVQDFLFGRPALDGQQPQAHHGRYLRIRPAIQGLWLREAVLDLRRAEPVRVKLAEAGIEMFLTSQGVGVLSITLEPFVPSSGLDFAEAVDFSYCLAQPYFKHPTRKRGPGDRHDEDSREEEVRFHLRIPHPIADLVDQIRDLEHDSKFAKDGAKKQLLEQELAAAKADLDKAQLQKKGIAPAPSSDDPVLRRVQQRGGRFTLGELAEELLAPLFAETQLQAEMLFEQRALAYTSVRFDSDVDFSSDDARRQLAPLLSALAQVEESNHAGASPELPGVSNLVLNRRHWAAVGSMGACHLVADQRAEEFVRRARVGPDERLAEHPFNVQRIPRMLAKYFVPYLCATLHGAILQRLSLEARTSIDASGRQRDDSRKLRKRLIQFDTTAFSTHVSQRHSLHRYYRLCQEGLDVRHALEDARRAIGDVDSVLEVEHQAQIAADTAHNIEQVASIQSTAAKIEILLVVVYVAHFVHMAYPAEHAEPGHHLELTVLIAGGLAVLFGRYLVRGLSRLWNLLPGRRDH